MLEEIVYTILPSNYTKTLKRRIPHENRAEYKRRRRCEGDRTEYGNQQPDNFMDDAETHKIKTKTRNKAIRTDITMLCLLVFIFILNIVIIKCDDSVNENILKHKNYIHGLHVHSKESTKYWHGHKADDKHWKSHRRSRASLTDGEDKADTYSGPEVPEGDKQYDYNQKYEAPNITEYPQYMKKFRYVQDDANAIGYPHDLISNPYYVKTINFNLRPETHQFNEKILKLGVLLPASPKVVFSLVKVLPILEIAIPAVTKPDGPLPGWKILVDYRDTGCSSVEGPLAAFEFYVNGSAGKFNFILLST